MFSMIYLWLIGAVVLAGADHSSRHDLPAHYCCSRIGRLYLCRDRSRDTVSAARVCRLCHCRLCLSVLSEKEKLRKHGCRPFAAHQRRTLRRSQGMERKRQSSSFLSRNRLGCQTGKRFTDGSRPLGDRRDERKYFNYQTQTGEIIWKQSEGSPYSSWCWQFLPSSSLQNRFASFLSRKPGSSNDSENFTPCFSRA